MFSSCKRNEWMKKFFLILLLSLIALSLSSCGESDLLQLEWENTFVYAVTLNDLTSIRSTLIPPGVDSIYFLSDTLNIISPRETRVYYWPLTNRYLADWNTLNTLIEGDLEVYRHNELVEVIPLQDYVIQYDTDNIAESLGIYIGDEAEEMYQIFKVAQLEYQQAMFDYYDKREDWIAELDELYKKMDEGEEVGEFPMEPEQPASFTLYSTDVIKGYPINLPDGEYTIRMKLPDGSAFPESSRNLVVFSERRQSVTYDVIPETRWTAPTESYNPGGVVYVTPGTEIYLQPYQGSEYRDLYYVNMLDPQEDTGRYDRWQWVPQTPLSDITMQISSQGKVLKELELQPFYVKQTSGSSLSYEVIPYDPETMKQISFEGFMIGTIEGYRELQVVLLDEEGNILPGSDRIIRLVNVDNGKYLYPLSAFPLLVGLASVFLRRRKTKSIQTPK
jgi:hypothetical protein